MVRHTCFRIVLGLFFVSPFLFRPIAAGGQSRDSVLTRLGEGSLDSLDSLASHAAQKIREANLEERKPTVLVIDFLRSPSGNSSRLGTLLADRFSESLAAYSAGLSILDRKLLKDYLTTNWMTLEDLQTRDVCLRIGRQIGATGVILGTLFQENGQISLTVHLEGFGPVAKEADIFQVTDERTRFLETEEMRAMLFEPGPSYARKADDIPEEPGVFKGDLGAGVPRCTSCPSPGYSDAARAAKFQGTVLLSIVVTTEGKASSIYVLKGAPFGLTTKAVEAVQDWRFEPAMKDGNPVSVRTQIETTFRLY
jgi:TonB family protein